MSWPPRQSWNCQYHPISILSGDPIVPDPEPQRGRRLDGQENFAEMDAQTGGAGLFQGLFAPGSLHPLLSRLYTTEERSVTSPIRLNRVPKRI